MATYHAAKATVAQEKVRAHSVDSSKAGGGDEAAQGSSDDADSGAAAAAAGATAPSQGGDGSGDGDGGVATGNPFFSFQPRGGS